VILKIPPADCDENVRFASAGLPIRQIFPALPTATQYYARQKLLVNSTRVHVIATILIAILGMKMHQYI
jgi:hypothetical protein